MALAWTDSIADTGWEELSALYEASPPMGGKPAAELRIVFGNSMFACFVHDDGKLVGAGRALADGASCAYICDIAVLPGHRGIGLGRKIVAELLRVTKGHKKIILYSVPGSEGFYRQFGFRRMRTAMALFANQPLAMERGYLDES